VSAVLLIAQQVASKAARDALFLSHFDASQLPKAVAAAALLSLLGVVLASRAYVALSPGRVVPVLLAASGLLFLGEWVAVGGGAPGWVAWAVFLHVAVFGAIVVSGFWSVVNERFDPHAAKRAVARIGVGATGGGVVGGLGAVHLVAATDLRTALLALSVLNGLCAVGVASTARGTSAQRGRREAPGGGKEAPSTPPPAGSPAAFRILRHSPYLTLLATLVGLVSLSGALLDWTLKASAASRYPSEGELVTFFAYFYTAMSVGTLLLQTAASRPLLERFGLGSTVAILPAVVILFGSIAVALPRLVPLAIARGAGYVVENSLFRSGYELLYTPIPAAEKRATKAVVDVGFDRLGDALASVLVLGLLSLLGTPTVAVLALALAAAALALLVALRIHRGYVSQLAANLRAGTLELDSGSVLDATTRQTLTETTMALDREKLLAEIQAFRRRQRADSKAPAKGDGQDADDAPGTRSSRPRGSDPAAGDADDPAGASARPGAGGDEVPGTRGVLSRIERLAFGDAPAARAALSDAPLDRRSLPFALPLVGRRETERAALEALRRVAPGHVGQLVDALLDPDQPFVVRRRLPRVIGEVRSQRAADGLLAALDDPRFEVRYQAGRALERLIREAPDLRRDPQRIFAVVHRELDVGEEVWRGQRRLLDPGLRGAPPDAADPAQGGGGPASVPEGPDGARAAQAPPPSPEDRRLVGRFLQDRGDRSLEHVFTLLGLALDPETVSLSFRALRSDDPNLRGTALEYLENVLPPEIRRHLWPHIARGAPRAARSREGAGTRHREAIVEDLLRSAEAIPLGVRPPEE